MSTTYYLEVEAPSIGALNDALRQAGIRTEAQHGGRLGFEVHYWITRADAEYVAGQLAAAGYPARVETRKGN